ncbi:MAG: hypothetical protein ACYC8T_39505, partial [Myxococcaceae bacterium]
METSLRSPLLPSLFLLACCGCTGTAGFAGEPPPQAIVPVEEEVPLPTDVPVIVDAGTPDAGQPEELAFGALDVLLHVEELAGLARAGEPVRSGVPLPRAAGVLDPSLLAVTDDSGKLVPYQLRVTSRWQGAPNDASMLHIGDYASIDEVGLKLPVAVGAGATYAFGGEGAPAKGPLTAEAFQRQSGALDAAMGARFNPGNADTLWYSNGGGAAGGGGKAPGWVDLSGSAGGVTAAVRWYWQQYPKKLSASPTALTIDLWPAEEVDLRVYAASQKTHEVLFSFHSPQVSPEDSGRSAAARLAEPLFARCEPAWYAGSRVWNRIGTADPAAYPATERAFVEGYF